MNGETELRRWLRRAPQPAKLRVRTENGERIVAVGASRSRWRDAEVACLGATRIEALDAGDAILRALDDDAGDEDASSSSSAQKAELAKVQEYAQIARIILDATDRGAERHSKAFEIAFESLAKMVETMSSRLQGLERAWHRLIMSQETTAQSSEDAALAQVLPSLLSGRGPQSDVASKLAGVDALIGTPAPKKNGKA